jgi:hypothetical protein
MMRDTRCVRRGEEDELPVLGETRTAHRLDLLVQIIRLLLKIVPDQRQRVLKEEAAVYELVEE